MRRSHVHIALLAFGTAFLLPLLTTVAKTRPGAALPPNIAKQAKVTASGEYDNRYQARNVIDDQIPEAESRDDAGRAWCIRGDMARGEAELCLAWAEPVAVAELICFGRTAFCLQECWKDYELYIDEERLPMVKGTLEMTDLPQRIALPQPRKLQQLVLRFSNSYGGPNPGVSELMAFGSHVSDEQLTGMSAVEEYPEWMPAELGRLLVVQRYELNPSHVYTYHAEGYKPGGGLYAFTPTPDGREKSPHGHARRP